MRLKSQSGDFVCKYVCKLPKLQKKRKIMGFITSDEAHYLAERERFELSEPLTVHTISSSVTLLLIVIIKSLQTLIDKPFI